MAEVAEIQTWVIKCLQPLSFSLDLQEFRDGELSNSPHSGRELKGETSSFPCQHFYFYRLPHVSFAWIHTSWFIIQLSTSPDGSKDPCKLLYLDWKSPFFRLLISVYLAVPGKKKSIPPILVGNFTLQSHFYLLGWPSICHTLAISLPPLEWGWKPQQEATRP